MGLNIFISDSAYWLSTSWNNYCWAFVQLPIVVSSGLYVFVLLSEWVSECKSLCARARARVCVCVSVCTCWIEIWNRNLKPFVSGRVGVDVYDITMCVIMHARVCMCVLKCVELCVYVYLCVYMRLCMCSCLYAYVFSYLCIFLLIYVRLYMCMYRCIFVYVCMYL